MESLQAEMVDIPKEESRRPIIEESSKSNEEEQWTVKQETDEAMIAANEMQQNIVREKTIEERMLESMQEMNNNMKKLRDEITWLREEMMDTNRDMLNKLLVQLKGISNNTKDLNIDSQENGEIKMTIKKRKFSDTELAGKKKNDIEWDDDENEIEILKG